MFDGFRSPAACVSPCHTSSTFRQNTWKVAAGWAPHLAIFCMVLVRSMLTLNRFLKRELWSGVAALGLVPGFIACAQTPVDTPDGSNPRRSRASDWSVLRPVPGLPSGRTLRWPSLATRGDTLLIAANHFPTEDSVPIGPRPLVVARIPGGLLRPPPGNFLFAYPKIVVARAGEVHLLWAESSEALLASRQWPNLVHELWHAVHDGRTWSQPQRLLRGTRLDWGAEHGLASVDSRGDLHVTVPMAVEPRYQPLMHLRRQAGVWHRSVVARWAAYASIVTWGSDSVAVAFSGADTTGQSVANTLFVAVSGDAGTSWSVPRRVEHGSQLQSGRAPLISQVSHELHLGWLSGHMGGSLTRWRHARSVDGGRTWLLAYQSRALSNVIGAYWGFSPCTGPLLLLERLDLGVVSVIEFSQADTFGREPFYRLFPSNTGVISGRRHHHVVLNARRRGQNETIVVEGTRRHCQ